MTDPSLIYGLGTLFFGVVGLAIRYAFKSKCKNVTCCYGVVSCDRNVDLENDLAENVKEMEFEQKN